MKKFWEVFEWMKILQCSSKNSTLRFECCVFVGFGVFFEGCGGFFLCVCCVGVFCLGSFCGFLFVCFTSLIYLFLKHSLKLWGNVFWPHTVTSRCVFLVIVFIGGSLLLAKFILNLISVVKKETYFCACKLLGHLVWL